MKLTYEEIDVICLALLQAQEGRQGDVANVYEELRKMLRERVPHNLSMNRLIKKYNKEKEME